MLFIINETNKMLENVPTIVIVRYFFKDMFIKEKAKLTKKKGSVALEKNKM
tara:strand:+ start:448 stop:600 length:153 start_codon:yes stop_codon:yes gene_type:complete